jgi:hypothetical protein
MSALSTIEAGFDQVSVISKTKAGRGSTPDLHLVTNSGDAASAPSCGSRTSVSVPPASPGARPSRGQQRSVGRQPSASRRPAVAQQPSGGQPRSAGQRLPASCVLPAGQRAPARRDAAPLRLTRRGRLVVGALAVLLATVALTVIAAAAAGRAQASNHGRDGAGYQDMHQIVVQPGETLWTIASQAEPSADPRQVIAEIMTANSMTSTVVQAGELLWVPK